MTRKIILLSDGTGNSAAQVWRTNVWRVFESLDLSKPDQVAFYDDGVGTSSFKPLAILGGAFGFGLKRNVIELYKFACRNVRGADDEIFGFGFSRGGFTIRIVVALIFHQGLVIANSEAELHRKAKAAYREYRRENFHTIWRIEDIFRWIRDLVTKDDYDKANNRWDFIVRFVGVWDTVAAYGMPVEEMTRGISQWIWPWQLPDTVLDSRVKRACQALSIDDERTTFYPVLWDERNERPLLPDKDGKRYLTNERVSQVWFAGVHSNVGGGYPDDSVAQIPLIWMLSEAKNAQLRFKSTWQATPQTFDHPDTAQDADGRVYDSRSGFASYYRYGPRKLLELCSPLLSRAKEPALPRVHESVLKRIRNNAHLYAPIGLPAKYELVTGNGEVLSPSENVCESASQAEARANFQEQIWNTVWWKRIAYFATVLVSVFLFVFPLAKERPVSDELTSRLRWVSDVIETVYSFLPSAVSVWIKGFTRDPGLFLITMVVLIGVVWWGSYLAGKIQNQMGILWRGSLAGLLTNPGEPRDIVYRVRTNKGYRAIIGTTKKYIAPAFFALLFVYLGLTLSSHALFNVQDDAGWVCRETPVAYKPNANDPSVLDAVIPKTLHDLGKGESYQQTFHTNELCQSLGVWVEQNLSYNIAFGITDQKPDTQTFRFGQIPAGETFYSSQTGSLLSDALMIAAVPLRRELIRPWYNVVIRVGGTGGEESFFDPDPEDPLVIDSPYTATRSGELFLFVNGPVIGIPRLYDYLYRHFNHGEATVTITRK